MAEAEFEDIAETFAFLEEWEERYRYLIELGKAMPPVEDALKVPATKVEGCASQVWLTAQTEGQGPQAVLRFRGDSDAMIVRGLIAVLLALYAGRTAADVLALDAGAALARLGLNEHLSAQRSNGVRAMVGRIRSVAAEAVQG